MKSEAFRPSSFVDSVGSVKVVACDVVRSVEANLVAPKTLSADLIPLYRERAREDLFLISALQSSYTHDWKVVKVEENEDHTNQAIVVLNKESLAHITSSYTSFW